MTYYQRVARRMSETKIVGSTHKYEDIVAALQRRFPDENDLRRYIGTLEKALQLIAPGFQFVDERPYGNEHGSTAEPPR